MRLRVVRCLSVMADWESDGGSPRAHSWESSEVEGAVDQAHGSGSNSWESSQSSDEEFLHFEYSDSDDDGENVSTGSAFANFIVDMLLVRTINARHFCTLMHYA